MAVITDECINCGSCIDECPNSAIYNAGESYKVGGQVFPPISEEHSFIVPQSCDDCGTCKEACAIGAIE
jgi:ferredoxin